MNGKVNYVKAATARLKPVTALGFSRSEFAGAAGQVIRAAGTRRSYKTCIAQFLRWRHEILGVEVDAPILAIEVQGFLEQARYRLQQKTLDQRAQALKAVTGHAFALIKSEVSPAPSQLAPTARQLRKVLTALPPIHRLAALIAINAGLRVSEITALAPPGLLTVSSHRTWSGNLHSDRTGVTLFNVIGKGGLVRSVAIANELVDELETIRLATPQVYRDRDVDRTRFYDFPLPQTISAAFTRAARQVLGYSPKLHATRSFFLHRSLQDLLDIGLPIREARLVVSQKAGHFRPDVTYAYFAGLSLADKAALQRKLPDWLLSDVDTDAPFTWRDGFRQFFASHRSKDSDVLNSQITALTVLDTALNAEHRLFQQSGALELVDGVIMAHFQREVAQNPTGAIAQAKIVFAIWVKCRLDGRVQDTVLSETIDRLRTAVVSSQTYSEWLLTIPAELAPSLLLIAQTAASRGTSLKAIVDNMLTLQPERKDTLVPAAGDITARDAFPTEASLWTAFDASRARLMALHYGAGRGDWKAYTQRVSKALFFNTPVRPFFMPGSGPFPVFDFTKQPAAIVARKRRERKQGVSAPNVPLDRNQDKSGD